MKKIIKQGVILGMIFLSVSAIGQTIEVGSKQIKEKATESSMHLVLNAVSTNMNYGKSNDAASDYKKSVLGAQVGLSFQAGVTPRFSLVSELYFIMKGGKLDSNNPLTESKTTLRLYTLESPMLVRFHFGKLYLNAGPSLAYNFYGTRKNDEGSTTLAFTNSTEGFKRFDAGIQTGAGYQFRLKQKKVVLDVRYSYGLTNISYDKEMYNRYLNINIHFFNPWKINPLGRNKNK